MPNRISPDNPREVQHLVKGRWVHKQTCESAAAAQRALNLLRGKAHGWEPTGALAKDVRNKARAKKAATARKRRHA